MQREDMDLVIHLVINWVVDNHLDEPWRTKCHRSLDTELSNDVRWKGTLTWNVCLCLLGKTASDELLNNFTCNSDSDWVSHASRQGNSRVSADTAACSYTACPPSRTAASYSSTDKRSADLIADFHAGDVGGAGRARGGGVAGQWRIFRESLEYVRKSGLHNQKG